MNTLVSLLSPLIYSLLNYLVECVKMTYHVSWNFRLLCWMLLFFFTQSYDGKSYYSFFLHWVKFSLSDSLLSSLLCTDQHVFKLKLLHKFRGFTKGKTSVSSPSVFPVCSSQNHLVEPFKKVYLCDLLANGNGSIRNWGNP